MRLRWAQRALNDMDRLWLFAAEYGLDRADRIQATIFNRALVLRDFPELGRQIEPNGIREFSLAELQYLIRYRFDDEELLILRVRHTRQEERS